MYVCMCVICVPVRAQHAYARVRPWTQSRFAHDHRIVGIRLLADLTRFRPADRTRLIHLSRVSVETSSNAPHLCSPRINETVPVSGVSCRLWKSGFLEYVSHMFVSLPRKSTRMQKFNSVCDRFSQKKILKSRNLILMLLPVPPYFL